MNEKLLIVIAILSTTCTYLYNNTNKNESIFHSVAETNVTDVTTHKATFVTVSQKHLENEGGSVGYFIKNSLRKYLEDELENEIIPQKSFAEYTLNDFLEILHPQPPNPQPEVEDNLPVLLQKVLLQKWRRGFRKLSEFLTSKEDSEELRQYLKVLAFIVVISR